MNLALFDFDGTVTNCDTYTKFIHHTNSPLRVKIGMFFLTPLILNYKLGLVSGPTMRTIVSWIAFRGMPESALKKAGKAYARDALPKVVRKNALKKIQWHQSRGDRVVLVSASLDVYLSSWCKSHNIELICTNLEYRNGFCTGLYIDGDCSKSKKKSRVLENYNLEDYSKIYAYGDTDEDREMLDLAHVKFFRWKKVKSFTSTKEYLEENEAKV